LTSKSHDCVALHELHKLTYTKSSVRWQQTVLYLLCRRGLTIEQSKFLTFNVLVYLLRF